jgi:lipoprotein-anchoring transpeptidase ErfK/SrfK
VPLRRVHRTRSSFRDEVFVKTCSAAGRAAEDWTRARALAGASRLALTAGLSLLFAAGAGPAHAQFGFSWFGMQPAPPVLQAPSPFAGRKAARPGPSLGELKSALASAAKRPKATNPVVGPVIIVVSVNRQRLTVYDGDRPIVSSPVSTGKQGHETPLGVFSVIQKEILHHSNLYDDAPMPFMQRITWSGVALHSGPLPGHAASHGCIRLPRDFAVRLWGMTKVGARVIVARNELTPSQFNDPRLFTLRDPATAPIAAAGAAPRAAADPADTTDRTRAAGQVASLASTPVPPTESEAGETRNGAPVQYLASTRLPSAYDEVAPTADEIAAASLNELRRATNGPSAPPSVSLGAEAKPDAPAGDVKPAVPKKAGPISIFVSRKEKKLFVRRAFEPVFDTPILFNGDQPLGTHVYTATNAPAEGVALHWVTLSIASAAYEPEPQPRKPGGPFDSRGRKVQAGPAPLPQASSAGEALERVQINSETRDRIAAMITPGSSLIISDNGLGSETAPRGTDFIVLTH